MSRDFYRLITLVPHRDSLIPLEKTRSGLFSRGFHGSFSLPIMAPLLMVSRSLKKEEIKEIAHGISTQIAEIDKISPSENEICSFPGSFNFFGPRLNISVNENNVPNSIRDAILHFASSIILSLAIIKNEDLEKTPYKNEELINFTPFRKAYLMNISIIPISSRGKNIDYSYKWKTGLPVWLPALKNSS